MNRARAVLRMNSPFRLCASLLVIFCLALVLVQSRPLFFFTPDSSKTPVTWSIWMIEAGPPGWPGFEVPSSAGSSNKGGGEESVATFNDARRSRAGEEQLSWGSVKCLYAGP